jgi:predicted DNA-binding transcriptional regulator AlpA
MEVKFFYSDLFIYNLKKETTLPKPKQLSQKPQPQR